MNSMQTADNSQKTKSQRANLDGRYGKIGISAVAAAVRFQGEGETRVEVYSSRFALNEND